MFAEKSPDAGKVRFGVFEMDLEAGELRKSGIRVKLQSQPFDLLAMLIEHAGEVVTKEDLRTRIWGNETVVDFDHSLGTAVNKVREALCDSASLPRYVETLARKGYRFIAPVQIVAGSGAGQALIAIPDHPATPSPPIPASPGANRRAGWMIRLAAGVAGASIIAAGLWLWRLPAQAAKIVRFTQITWSDRIYRAASGPPRFARLATDGTNLFYSKILDGKVVLVRSTIAGGETYPLATPAEISSPALTDISPDGSMLLVRSRQRYELEETLWIVPTTGGDGRKAQAERAHDATWHPNGRSILYASGRDLFLRGRNAATSRKLATLPGRAFWLRYSPDGSRIRFTLVDPSTDLESLWEIASSGQGLRPLLPGWNNPPAECCGSWTADGRNYVFQSTRGGRSDVWILPEPRKLSWSAPAPMQVTAGPLGYAAPLPARRGSGVFVIATGERNQLFRFDTAGRRFVPCLLDLSATGRTEFSNDGRQVAWIRGSDYSLWQSKPDGSQRQQLTSGPLRVFMMRWSPDARRIAFMGRLPGKPWKIYVIPADGGTAKMLTTDNQNEADPAWSADGESIAFGRPSLPMASGLVSDFIRMINLKTNTVSIIPGSEGLFCPRWSPDGRYIAAMPLDQRKLMLFEVATSTWTATPFDWVDNPLWSRDGQSIYFRGARKGNSGIFRMSLASRRIDQVADFRSLPPSDAISYSGLSPENAPIVSTRFVTADIFGVEGDPVSTGR